MSAGAMSPSYGLSRLSIAARIIGFADEEEVLESSTVKDLLTAFDLAFADRSEHALKGVPGTWHLYGVAAGSSPS
jgi:class 3 adenylate cyclase